MARATILDKKERGFVNFRGMGIDFLSQLARIGRGDSMLSIHSGGKIPGIFGVEVVADDNFVSTITYSDSSLAVLIYTSAGNKWRRSPYGRPVPCQSGRRRGKIEFEGI
jgi:hypothetical protein